MRCVHYFVKDIIVCTLLGTSGQVGPPVRWTATSNVEVGQMRSRAIVGPLI